MKLEKTFRIGTAKTHNGRPYSIFVKAEFDGKRLSISGVEGPLKGGDCVGACGQINMSAWDIESYAPGWSAEMEGELRKIWEEWHLNDLRAECEHQRTRGENWKNAPSAVCPECGWQLGHAWRPEPVPQSVIEALSAMPEADRQPAWV